MKRHYNLHGLMSVEADIELPILQRAISCFDLQFRNFACAPGSAPDIKVTVGRINDDTHDCHVYDNKIWARDGYLRFDGSRKFSRWSVEYEERNGRRQLLIRTNLAGALTIPYFFTEFFIYHVLQKKGASIIHAAGLERDGQVLLLPGASGGGKTTIGMTLLENNFRFMGDNYLIVKDGWIYSYPSPLNIFSYNLVPLIRRNLTLLQRLDLLLRFGVFRVSGGYLKLLKKLNPAEVVGDIACRGRPTFAAFLQPSDLVRLKAQPVDRERAIRRLISNMKLEWADLEPARLTSVYAGSCDFVGFWDEADATLFRNLEGFDSFFEYRVPHRYDDRSRQRVVDDILDRFT